MNECFFYDKTGCCDILTVKKCPKKCRFRKTEFEYNLGIKKAELSLISKGLKAVTKDGVVTVEKIGECE